MTADKALQELMVVQTANASSWRLDNYGIFIEEQPTMTIEEAAEIAVKVLQAPPFNFDESEARRFAEAFKVALSKS